MSALDEIIKGSSWEFEEQFMDGADLGYSDPVYVGEGPRLDEAQKELEGLHATIDQYDKICTEARSILTTAGIPDLTIGGLHAVALAERITMLRTQRDAERLENQELHIQLGRALLSENERLP